MQLYMEANDKKWQRSGANKDWWWRMVAKIHSQKSFFSFGALSVCSSSGPVYVTTPEGLDSEWDAHFGAHISHLGTGGLSPFFHRPPSLPSFGMVAFTPQLSAVCPLSPSVCPMRDDWYIGARLCGFGFWCHTGIFINVNCIYIINLFCKFLFIHIYVFILAHYFDVFCFCLDVYVNIYVFMYINNFPSLQWYICC